MVPLVVAVVTRHIDQMSIVLEVELLSVKSDIDLILGIAVRSLAGTVAEEHATTIGIGTEPEHQGKVLILIAVDELIVERNTLILPVDVERHASGHLP